MNYRALGSTGIEVSEIGMGCWGIGGEAYGPVSPIQSVNTLQAALDAGVTFYDTAPMYGVSEEVIGLAFGHQRDKGRQFVEQRGIYAVGR